MRRMKEGEIMKLRKKENSNGGYNIYCTIGNREIGSWWSGPMSNIDHAGQMYLQGRYPFITTKKRAIEFKRLYKLLWIEITEKQRKEMSNSLGLLHSNKPYRNRFYTDREDKSWNDLVEKGLAEKGSGGGGDNCFYHLTKEGVEYILGRNIKQSTYDDL